MEHRWHPRNEVDFNVVIYHDGLPVACGRAHNLSASGLLVHPGAQEMELNAPVELEFALRTRQGSQRLRVPAQVVHQSETGTGVMFDCHQLDTQRKIDRVLAQFTPVTINRAHSG